MWDPFTEFDEVKLPNGLTVYGAHWPNRSWAALGIVVYVGAANDPIGLEGLSHFVEHVLPHNTKHTKKKIKELVWSSGGEISLGTTSDLVTSYSCFLPSTKKIIAKTFDLFGQMLIGSKLEKDIEDERQIIINEYNRKYVFKFYADLRMKCCQSLYHDYWLGRMLSPMGSPESVKRVTQNDLQIHYDRYYNPSNISLVYIGGLKVSEILTALETSAMSILKNGKRFGLLEKASECPMPIEKKYFVTMKNHAEAGFPEDVCTYETTALIPGIFKQQAVRIFRDILNDKLFTEIRDKRLWAYSIDCRWYNFIVFYELHISCQRIALRAVDKIGDVVEKCIKKTAEDKKALEKMKKEILLRHTLYDTTGLQLRNDVMIDLEQFQRIVSITETQEEIKNISSEDMKNIATYLDVNRRCTLIERP